MTILSELKQHNQREKASFHMPGHKNGAGIFAMPLKENPFRYDTTELADTDALIEPSSSILKAEEKAAELYGAAHSFYLVNGSTCGILAMFYLCFKPGDVVLVDRNCHRSVLHACALTGVTPIYMVPSDSRYPGVPGVLDAMVVEEALGRYPQVRGVFVTSPNYYGAVADLKTIAEAAHKQGAYLLVDEAHGAHFAFSEQLPQTAMQQGADCSVVSAHKTLGAPNQTALLHTNGSWDADVVREAIHVFQTSSPSFVLLSAMEEAILWAEENGARKTEWVKACLKDLPYIDDPLKRLLLYGDKGYSGYEVDEILRTKFGIYAELCDRQSVLLMSSWANSEEDFARLHEAVSYLDSLPLKQDKISENPIFLPTFVQPEMTPQEVHYAPNAKVLPALSEGKISAQAVTAFPPCIPIILPGERITKNQINILTEAAKSGARITGLDEENRLRTVKEN